LFKTPANDRHYHIRTGVVCAFVSMQPLVVLATVFAVLIVPLGWWTALRFALAAMFLLGASAHWGKRRADLIRMVPAMFSHPILLVTLTGIFELAGAVGLLIPSLAPIAAAALALLLLAIFPANVRAAREKIGVGGRPPTPLPVRAAIQVIFLLATIGVVIGARQ
jgi:uncharacterized membrane protein